MTLTTQSHTQTALLIIHNRETPNHKKTQPKDKNDEWYEIDKILACKRQDDGMSYRVKWKGHSETQWVPSHDVSDFAKREFHIKKTTSGKT